MNTILDILKRIIGILFIIVVGVPLGILTLVLTILFMIFMWIIPSEQFEDWITMIIAEMIVWYVKIAFETVDRLIE